MRVLNIIFLLLLLTPISIVYGIFIIDDFGIWQNEEYCTLNATAFRRKLNESSLINATFTQTVDFEKEVQSRKDDAYSNVIFKTVLDVCKMSKGVIGNFVVKVVLDTIQKAINFPIACPFKKGTYTISNFRPSADFVPIQLQTNRMVLNAKLMGKIKTQKSLIHVYTLNVFVHFE